MPLEKYNLRFPDNATAADIELICFHRGHSPEQGGLGRFGHWRNAVNLIWNEPRRRYAAERKIAYDPDQQDAYIWNDWSDWMQERFCDTQWMTVTGSGASWKTTSAGLYVNGFWLASPQDTVAIVTSTTLDGLRRRIWKETTKYHRATGIGNLVQSRNCIQFTKGSDDAGIFGIAVDKGEVDKAISKIIGFHARRILVVVDEMQTMNEAIVEACVNLESGCEEFQFIGLGNAGSRFDPHGRMSEPADGWNSITDETPEWRTKRGVCIHLDGRDSPNVRAGVDKFPGMLKQRDLDNTIERYGENSPQFWQMRIGFWAPEGITKTILSETTILRFKAKDAVTWETGFKKAAGLDPSFEGNDRKVLRIVEYGKSISGKFVIAFHKTYILKVQVHDGKNEPINYQTVRQTKAICEEEGVPPERFGLDSTGAGGPLADIFAREWSPRIHRINFGGRASDRPVSETNPRKCWEEYGNKVTELWYGFSVLVRNEHIRQLDDDTAKEFCSRFYELRGNILYAETKVLMKARTGKSPDLADGAVTAVAVVQAVEPELSGSGGELAGEISAHWHKLAKDHDAIYDESEAYAEEEEYAGS